MGIGERGGMGVIREAGRASRTAKRKRRPQKRVAVCSAEVVTARPYAACCMSRLKQV